MSSNAAVLKSRFQRFLAEKGLRSTSQRDLILDVFLKSQGHLNIDELYWEIRRAEPRIGFATVYRTMKLLAQAGVALERHFGDVTRYEHSPSDAHHDHLICLGCGSIIEFFNPEIERIQSEVATRHHFAVSNHRLEMFGFCRRCQRPKKQRR